MEIVYNLTLDMMNHGPVMICAKQGDDNTRYVRATLTANGAALDPATEGITASFRCRKPDGNGCYNPATINADGTVTAELTQQVLAVPGTVMADICLHGPNDEILSTASFVIRVEAAPNGNNVTSSNEFLELEQLVSNAKDPDGNGNGASGIPAYTEADYGKFLSCSAEGLVWAEAIPDGEEMTF